MNKLKLAVLALTISFTSSPSTANDHTVIATDKIEWGLLNPLRGDASPRAADLWGDRTKDMATGMLVKFKKRVFLTATHSQYYLSWCRDRRINA